MWQFAYILLFILHGFFLKSIGKYAFYTIPLMAVLGFIVFLPVIKNVLRR